MIIIAQYNASTLSNLVVDENQFIAKTELTKTAIVMFNYNSDHWEDIDGQTIDLADYGVSYTGIPDGTIVIAYEPTDLYKFSAGKGINSVKINYNFANLQQKTNINETKINNIAVTALRKDGTNLTQDIVDRFQQQTPNIISGADDISLTDNSANFLTLTGNGNIKLPTIASDVYSHTISLVVEGSAYSLDLGTSYCLYNNLDVDTTQTYNVIYIYNKLDNHWYYSLTQ